MTSQSTSVLIPCGIDGCTNIVKWMFERGEPQTYSDPGLPDIWLPLEGCDEIKSRSEIDGFEVSHTEILAINDDNQTRCNRISVESFDNDMEYCDYDIEIEVLKTNKKVLETSETQIYCDEDGTVIILGPVV